MNAINITGLIIIAIPTIVFAVMIVVTTIQDRGHMTEEDKKWAAWALVAIVCWYAVGYFLLLR